MELVFEGLAIDGLGALARAAGIARLQCTMCIQRFTAVLSLCLYVRGISSAQWGLRRRLMPSRGCRRQYSSAFQHFTTVCAHLDQKVLEDAVEDAAIVEALQAQLHEVPHRLRCRKR